jgi:uncharacterized protein (TIGR03083 family)
MMTAVNVAEIPALSHAEAMDLQRGELDRTVALLGSLEPAQWTAATDCPAWNVRQMYLHVLGACDAAASMRENMHQMRAGRSHRRQHGGPLEAGLSEVQVRERASLTPAELLARLTAVAPIAIKKRTSLPGFVRHGMRMKVDGPVFETWRLGYLIDTIYLRDLWMHRIDTGHAIGRATDVTAEHDGRIVADVVAEWARRHGQPVTLLLTGPAGGLFVAGDATADTPSAAPHLELDGRAPGEGLLATVVPF